jgi:hypothetical protein
MGPSSTGAEPWSPGRMMSIDKSDPAPPDVYVNTHQAPLLTKEWATAEGPDKLFPAEDFSSLGLPKIPVPVDGLEICISSQTMPLTAILTVFDEVNPAGIPTHEAGLYIYDSQTRELDITADGDDLVIRPNTTLPNGMKVVVLQLSYGLTADDLQRMPQYDMSWSNRASYGIRVQSD